MNHSENRLHSAMVYAKEVDEKLAITHFSVSKLVSFRLLLFSQCFHVSMFRYSINNKKVKNSRLPAVQKCYSWKEKIQVNTFTPNDVIYFRREIKSANEVAEFNFSLEIFGKISCSLQ